MFSRLLAAIAAGAFAGLAAVHGEPPEQGGIDLEADAPMEYDHRTREFTARENARLTYQGMLLVADEIVYSEADRVATATGNVSVTGENFRIVGQELRLYVDERRVEGDNLRAGSPPFLAEADSVSATEDLYELEESVFYLAEPQPFALNVAADSASYYPGERVEAGHVSLRVGNHPFFYLPGMSRSLEAPRNEVHVGGGYSRHLGAYLDLGVRVPVHPAVALGAEGTYFTRRGVLAGPAAEYALDSGDHQVDGSVLAGYIRDREDPGLDRLERPIGRNRYFAEWRHKQRSHENWEVTATGSGWSDSEMTRDFRPGLFDDNQFPDNFLEAAYVGDRYIVSAFSRVSPNDFQVVQERLPEVTFDYLPAEIGSGFIHRFHAGAAALREERPSPMDNLPRSDRLDAYYQLSRPFAPTDWLSVTPVGGGRVTHYERPLEGRNAYTRFLGEIGFDAEMHSFAVYDYENEIWGIDGIRHVLKPRMQYRFIPDADQGEEFIPPIDRRAFITRLEPIGLDSTRNIDDLGPMHTFRYGLDNIFQTRREDYGSRDLLTLYVANDLRFSRETGERLRSDVHGEASFMPIDWLRLDLFNRYDSSDGDLHEANAAFTLTDSRFWSVRFGADYLEDFLEQYSVDLYRRLNESYSVAADIRYDTRLGRFTRQTYSLFHNIHETWEIEYQLIFRTGSDREGATGFGFSVSYLAL